MSIPTRFRKSIALVPALAVLALAGCSHQKTPVPTQHPAAAPAVSAKPVVVVSPEQVAKTETQLFVTAFGHGQLKVMKMAPGPGGLTAALVAPSGTKSLTPETPAAILWIVPGGHYALQGNLITMNGKNLTDQFLEKLGMTPVLIQEPASPPVATTKSTGVPAESMVPAIKAKSSAPVSTKAQKVVVSARSAGTE